MWHIISIGKHTFNLMKMAMHIHYLPSVSKNHTNIYKTVWLYFGRLY